MSNCISNKTPQGHEKSTSVLHREGGRWGHETRLNEYGVQETTFFSEPMDEEEISPREKETPDDIPVESGDEGMFEIIRDLVIGVLQHVSRFKVT